MNKRFSICALSVLLVGLTASCGPLTGSTPKKQPQAQQASSENLIGQNNAGTSALEVPPPVALPPKYGDRPLKPGETQSAVMPNGLPALQPKGVNVESLFTENISNADSRFDRLENAVTGLRREFESFKPAIVRLVAVESDIQDLIKQLDMLLRNEPTPPPPSSFAPPQQLSPMDQEEPSKPAAANAIQARPPPTPQANAATSTSGGPFVKALRVGNYSDKVRLVMDVSKKTSHSVDLDNQENLLIIELPDARWNAVGQQSFSKSPILKSYSVENINGGKGSRVILSLKKGTQILKEQALPPGSNPNHRIFLDLKT